MEKRQVGTDKVKRGMAEMQKGGVIMDVINAEQAKIAEAAGAGRWGKGLQGNTVFLLRAARLDGAQVAVAAGAEVARQWQV